MPKITASVSIPLELFQEIDDKRGQVSRSSFCLNLIETGLKKKEIFK